MEQTTEPGSALAAPAVGIFFIRTPMFYLGEHIFPVSYVAVASVLAALAIEFFTV